VGDAVEHVLAEREDAPDIIILVETDGGPWYGWVLKDGRFTGNSVPTPNGGSMGAFRAAVFLVLIGSAGQSGPDPGALLKEADRLAWLRAWSAAEPQYLQAQKLFASSVRARALDLALPYRQGRPEADSRQELEAGGGQAPR
jgi:hypothetical protein